VERYHHHPPRSRLLDVTEAFDYTLEIRWQKTVSVRMETTLAGSDLDVPHILSDANVATGL